jgi:hypothetical protein
LLEAAAWDYATVKLLLAANATATPHALHVAMACDDRAIVRLLCDGGCDVVSPVSEKGKLVPLIQFATSLGVFVELFSRGAPIPNRLHGQRWALRVLAGCVACRRAVVALMACVPRGIAEPLARVLWRTRRQAVWNF